MNSANPASVSGWRQRFQVALQLRSLASPRVQKVLLIASALFLLVGLVLSIKAQPQALEQAHWPSLLFATAVLVPLSLALAMLEFMASARLIGRSLTFRYALITVICGSAANMLPLPGAFMARLASLKGVGARYRDGAYATLFTTLVWLSVACLWSGAWLASFEPGPLAMLLLAAGLVFAGLCVPAAKWMGGAILDVLFLFSTRLALISNQSLRLLVCLMAIQLSASFAQTAVLSLSALVGSAASLVPAGIGIREGAAAALGPAIGLTAAAGFLAAFLNRLIGLAVLVPLASLLAWRGYKAEIPEEGSP